MNHGSLFSGIGGFDLAAQWMGWENKFHCEWNEFGQQVLKYYWPNAETYTDITETDFNVWRGKIDILTGGFPCQPYSVAGKRLGKEDERHLWPEMLRAIREIEPRWVLGENVYGLVNWNGGLVFEEVCADLEAEGYKVQPVILPAASLNAPHRRDRIWFVAYRHRHGQKRDKELAERFKHFAGRQTFGKSNTDVSFGDATNTFSRLGPSEEHREKKARQHTEKNKGGRWQDFPTQSPVCTRDDGVSSRLDGITFPKWRSESIKAGGNAIVPQVAFEIFKVIQKIDLDERRIIT